MVRLHDRSLGTTEPWDTMFFLGNHFPFVGDARFRLVNYCNLPSWSILWENAGKCHLCEAIRGQTNVFSNSGGSLDPRAPVIVSMICTAEIPDFWVV